MKNLIGWGRYPRQTGAVANRFTPDAVVRDVGAATRNVGDIQTRHGAIHVAVAHRIIALQSGGANVVFALHAWRLIIGLICALPAPVFKRLKL